MTDAKLKRVPIPCYGASKYRPIAEEILDAYRDGEAVLLPHEMYKRLAMIRSQIWRIVHHRTGQSCSFRLQTQHHEATWTTWIQTVDDESAKTLRDAAKAPESSATQEREGR
jgi:hypothetical protein